MFIGNKKCRIYAACGVSQTPIIYNVKEEYLAAVFETVKKTYGSMEKFFQTVFYLKPKMIEEFRNKYLI